MNKNPAPGSGHPQRGPARAPEAMKHNPAHEGRTAARPPEANLRAGTPYFLSKTLESAGFLGYNTR